MQHWTSLDAVPDTVGPAVLTLGNFDGVHRGHQAVLARVVGEARQRRARAVAVTFEPHPLAVLIPDRAPVRLSGPDQRADLIATHGIDGLLTLTFTREFASLTPREFVESVMVTSLGAIAVVVGRDTRFGVANSGNVDTLRELGAELGFDVVVLDDVGEQARWSSSAIRASLAKGAVADAAAALGHLHRVTGVVVHGDHRGRELGYPTANLAADSEGMVPADGVYAGWLVRHDPRAEPADARLPAAISVGTNPTFEGTQRRVEAYALDRVDLDLYGERVSIEFAQRLRPTLKFDSIEDLVAQMGLDVAQCRSVLTS